MPSMVGYTGLMNENETIARKEFVDAVAQAVANAKAAGVPMERIRQDLADVTEFAGFWTE